MNWPPSDGMIDPEARANWTQYYAESDAAFRFREQLEVIAGMIDGALHAGDMHIPQARRALVVMLRRELAELDSIAGE